VRLRLIHVDETCAAIDKPSGLVVHRSEQSADRRTCMSLLRDRLGRHVYPVHRLDRGASGVLIFGLDPPSARSLALAFTERRVSKSYLAVVRGWAPESGEIERPLAREPGGRSDPALTRFRSLARAEVPHAVGRYPSARYSLVAAEPHTGRTHQLRRHLAGIAHPIVGDVTHGDSRHNRFFREHFSSRRLLLHAWRLELPHPHGAEPLDLVAPPAGELQRLLLALGWQDALAGLQPPAAPGLEASAAGAAGR
jgi:tRNA pseudouridine65 synthase